jgi:hypothetical protein
MTHTLLSPKPLIDPSYAGCHSKNAWSESLSGKVASSL